MIARHPGALALGIVRGAVFALCLAPLARLAWLGYHDRLGANPIEYLTRETGEWTLILLLVTLGVTPLRRLTGWNWLLRLRRMLGLYAFFYGSLHFLAYLWLDQFFDWMAVAADIWKRPFITAGFLALVAMIPLAVTSTDAMVRRLGARRWLALHRLAYLAALAGVVHYWWLVKADVREPVLYAALLALLLGARVLAAARARAAAGPRSPQRRAS